MIAVEDEVEQAGGAAVFFKCLLNPVKELSSSALCLNPQSTCCQELDGTAQVFCHSPQLVGG